LNELRAALDAAHSAKRQLEVSAAQQAETCERLSQANDSLSSRALTLADEAEQEKRKMQKKLEKEIDDLKAELDGSKEDLDDIRARLVHQEPAFI
jgi:archaellum component FlaC